MYPFIVVDGSLYLYRAYYAIPIFENFSGDRSTHVIYCVLNMLKNLLIRYNPHYVVVVFDHRGKNFRNRLFTLYKSHRPCMPKDLSSQIDPLRAVIQAMGLMTLMIADVEADDTIGTLVSLSRKNHNNVLISTCDKDMAQLVAQDVYLFNIISKNILGPKEIFEKFGVPPKLMVDYLALVGDISDNIPGVPGIGKKIARILLKNLGNLQCIYKKIEKIRFLNFRGSEHIIDKLKKHYRLAWLSYHLAKIKTNVKINVSYDDLLIKRPHFNILHMLFKKYNFINWINILKTKRWPWVFYSK
ncbi:MAG: DNA polymerase I [Candidatus Westeberhardia cardiocondylae]|nr:DNA polymerase I [Candidatus Westeberhardia cardiocondylae]